MNKPYRLAMCAGRFQHIHKIHEFMIDTGLYLADEMIVFIGEPNECRTIRNPFSYQERKELIERVFVQKIVFDNIKLHIYPLIDIKYLNLTLPEWCGYARNCAEMLLGIKPDLIIEGPDKRSMKFFKPEDMKDMSEFIISENVWDGQENLNIRGTEVRKFLKNGDFENWKKCVHPNLYWEFDRLRDIISECEE